MYSLHSKLFYLKKHYSNLNFINFGSETSLPLGFKKERQTSIYEGLEKLLINQNMDIKFTYINASTFNFSSPKDIENMLKHNVTVTDIKRIQRAEINELKSNKKTKHLVPKDIDGEMLRTDMKKETYLTSVIADDNPVIIYSTAMSEFMKQLKQIKTTRNKIDYLKVEKALVEIVNSIGENFKLMYYINSDVDILLTGIYFPRFIGKIFPIIPNANIIKDLMLEYKLMLKDLCNMYGAKYVDIESIGQYTSKNDIHLDSNANEIIARKILEGLFDKNRYELCPSIRDSYSFNSDIAFDRSRLTGLYFDALKSENKNQTKILEKVSY